MKIFTLVVTVFFTLSAQANNYYFSTISGNDSRTSSQAQNSSTPWKTLNKLNSIFSGLQPGDSVLFRRGEVFLGIINISASGTSTSSIVLASYGTGGQPIITGFAQMSNWISLGNGIWESPSSNLDTTLNNLLFNGNVQQMGRYPNIDAANSGYLTIESHVGDTQITDNHLSADPVWTGGEVVIRKRRWILDRNIISNHVGNSISYLSASRYEAKDNFGYFIQNHPKTLDQLGEWYYDKNLHHLQVFFGTNMPSSYQVKASTYNNLVSLQNRSFVQFIDLTFEGANMSTFEVTNTENIKIINCNIRYSGENGITGFGAKNLSLIDNTIEFCNNNGIDLQGTDFTTALNTIIKNNTIKNIGILPGMGKSGDNSYNGINLFGKSGNIENNSIENIGYIPIHFNRDSITIANNYINYFCFTKDDGGGIYTWGGDDLNLNLKERKIISNIILNGAGAGDGTDDPYTPMAQGIYMDDWTNTVQILTNTVAFNAQFGIVIHNASNISVANNTIFNNYYSQMLMNENNVDPYSGFSAERALVRNNFIKNNIFFSKEFTEDIAYFTTIKNDISSFGSLDSNYYCRPVNDNFNLLTSFRDTITNTSYYNNYYSLENWQSTYQKDISSQKSPVAIRPYQINSLVGNNKFSNGNFNSNISGTSCSSSNNSCNVSWNTGVMNGGSLKYSFTSLSNPLNKSLLLINIGDVSSSKNYLLKFSLKGTKRKQSLAINLRRAANSNDNLTYKRYCKLDTVRTENEFLISYLESESNATLAFEVEEQDSSFWIDNIELIEANATITNPGDSIRFEYNTTSSNKSITLNGTYVDAKNKKYTGNVNLPPFSSLVLVNKPACTTNNWLGTSDNSWQNPLNWSCEIIPDENTNVTIGPGTPFNCIIDYPSVCRSLTLQPGAFFRANKNLTVKH